MLSEKELWILFGGIVMAIVVVSFNLWLVM
jgi:hypothetical protein